MGMVRAIRMLNAASSGNLTGAQIETLLTTGDRLGEWQQLLTLRGQALILAASPTALDAVFASPTARAAVFASPTALDAVFASPTARAAVFASPTAMAAAAESVAAKEALWASDTALAAIQASATAMAAMRAASGYVIDSTNLNGTTPVTISLPGARYILLGVSQASGGDRILTMTTARSGTTQSVAGATVGASSTNADTVDLAGPLQSPYTAVLNNTGNMGFYIGLLRVDT